MRMSILLITTVFLSACGSGFQSINGNSLLGSTSGPGADQQVIVKSVKLNGVEFVDKKTVIKGTRVHLK